MKKPIRKLTSNRGNTLTFKCVYPDKNNPKVMAQLALLQKDLNIISKKEAEIYIETWGKINLVEKKIHNELKSLLTSSSEVL